MKVRHTIPTRETRQHERTLDCPCGPSQSVAKTPGEQPAVVITHHALPRSKP